MILRLLLCALVAMAGNAVLHLGPGLCLFHAERFSPVTGIPVIYGLPTGEAFEEARQGRIALGGCLAGPVDFVCPHCHWPVRPRGTREER